MKIYSPGSCSYVSNVVLVILDTCNTVSFVAKTQFSKFQTATKKIQGNIRDETQAISDLAAKIRLDNAEYAEKVAELQKIDK